MQTLLPLELEGVGTRSIEALPSYLCRLAAMHGTKLGELLTHVAHGTDDSSRLMHGLRAQTFSALVRPTTPTESVVDLLARGKAESRQNLERGTFLHLRKALARAQGTYSKQLRWCPGCFHEQLLDHGHAYLKLSWFLVAVSACDIHRIVLRDGCPHCGHNPKPWRGWASFEQCPYCDGRLDLITSSDNRVLDPEPVASDLIDLVGEVACSTEPFPAREANRYIAHRFEESWRQEREQELWKKLPRDECLRYQVDGEPITLAVARRLAYRLEIPIADLLRGGATSNRAFGFATAVPLPSSMRSAHRNGLIDSAVLAKQLRLLLDPASEPLSLREIARRLHVSVGAMRYHAPLPVAKLAERYKRHLRAVHLEKQSTAVRAVLDGIREWHLNESGPIANKTLLKRLMKTTGLPKEVLRKAIKDCRR